MEWIRALGPPTFFYLVVFGILTSIEIFWRRGEMTVSQRAAGLKFWGGMVLAQGLAAYALFGLIATFNIQPLITIHWSWGSAIVAAIVSGLCADFLFYWYHRAQHRWFWRWHSVHHSIENLSAINSYHHWSEPFFSSVLTTLPFAFFDLQATPQWIYLAFVIRLHPYYIHTASRLHLGPVGKFVIDNRFHRLHHSTDERHFNSNFGAVTTLWDHLFGTARVPADGEWPKVGLINQREPATIREWSSAPWLSVNAQPTPPARC
jgi:sterol desaturase/sphingolipid hydroxylase (fatty acid hydroxylase superfamily)